MTDDSNARYRSSDPFARTPGPGEHSSDPLAELARLIGQSDPFHQPHRDPLPAEPAEHRYDEPAPQQEPSYDDRPAYDSRYDAPYSNEPAPAPYSHDPAPARFSHDPAPAPFSHEPEPAPDLHIPPAPSFDPFASPARQMAAHAADHSYQEPQSQPRAFHSDLGAPAAPTHRFDAPSFGGSSRRAEEFPLANALADPGPMPVSQADEYYDDAPQGGRRKGLLTVAAVLCLAVVGTGAAFGYRTLFGGASVKAPPPVIRASAEPSKVAPPPQAAPPDANKITYDRFGDRGQNEKVVAREEKPVDVKEAARSGPPRPSMTSATASAGAAPSAANPPSVLTEPKRVRTVQIRPDGSDASPAPAQRPPTAAMAPARQAAVSSANAPLDLANPVAPPPAARASAPPMRAAAARATPEPPPGTTSLSRAPEPPPGTAPLSLAPDSNPPPAPARAAPARVAAAPAVTTGNAGNGNYLVQVSSQRSEADAQAAFRSIKSKYSNVLGERQAVIRRAELAGKGTYYRAMVGPFASRDQAVQLCSSLKAAGGDCVVQSN